jgi:hypothetical protein
MVCQKSKKRNKKAGIGEGIRIVQYLSKSIPLKF